MESARMSIGTSGPWRDPKLISNIVVHLDKPRDLLALALVCKAFLYISAKKIWSKPAFSSRAKFDKFFSTLSSPHQRTLPYPTFVTTISLNAFPGIKDDQFTLLGACENLSQLDMRMCQKLSATTLQHTFSQLHWLKTVDLEGVPSITDEVISSLAQSNPFLRCLKLGKSDRQSLSDAALLALGDYCGDNLRELHLPSLPSITSVALRCIITRCPRLHTLDVSRGKAVDDGVIRLIWPSFGQTLRVLSLSGCSELTDSMVPPGLSHETYPKDMQARPLPPIPKQRFLAPNLKEIDLTDCAKLTDYAIGVICTNSPKLCHIILKGCRLLTDTSLHSIAQVGSSVQRVILAKLSEITDEGVRALTKGCKKLTSIDLSECKRLTNASVVALSHLSRLESLRLNRNDNVTDAGIMCLANPTMSASLKRVHLSFCKNITAFAINFLIEKHKRITFLSLSGIPYFLDDPTFQVFGDPANKSSKPDPYRVCSTAASVAQLRTILSNRYPNATSSSGTGNIDMVIPAAAWAASPAPAPVPKRKVSPAQQSKPMARPQGSDTIVGAGAGTETIINEESAIVSADMNPESSKKKRKPRAARKEREKATATITTPPPQTSEANAAGIEPQSSYPPPQVEAQPPPLPSYPPPQSPAAQTSSYPPPTAGFLETSFKQLALLRHEPLSLVAHLPLQNHNSKEGVNSESSAADGGGGPSDHVRLSGSISSFEDLEDRVSEYDILDKSDLDSIADSVEIGSTFGSDGGLEGGDVDDGIVNLGSGKTAATLVNPGALSNGVQGKDGARSFFDESDGEDDFECVEIPEM